MPHRNEDGTFRNHHKTKIPSAKTIRARWIEAEILRLKDEHLKDEAIANHLTLVGRGQRQPLVPFPSGITFPPNFSITHQAVSKAHNRAVDRIPLIEVQRLLKQTDRDLENTLTCLAPGVRNGDPRAANASTRVHELRLRLHGGLRGGANIQVNTEVKTYPAQRREFNGEMITLFQKTLVIMRDLGWDMSLPSDQTPVEREPIETTASKVEEPSRQLSNDKDESPPATKGEPERPTESTEPKQIPWYAQPATYHVDPDNKERRPSWDYG